MTGNPPNQILVCPYRVGERLTRYSTETYETDAVVWAIRDLGDICVITLKFKNGFTEEFKTKKVALNDKRTN
jgi:hypothetical protein